MTNYFWIETGNEKIEHIYTEQTQQYKGINYCLVCLDLLEDFHENVAPVNSYKSPEQGFKFFQANIQKFSDFNIEKDVKSRKEYLLLNNVY